MKIRKYLNINTTEELSKQLGLSLDNINRVFIKMSNYYVFHEKVKDKKGKERNFYEAKGDLKIIHDRIDKNLLNKIYFSETIQGGIKGRSIKTNAQFHTNKRYVANFDISKFFPTVNNRFLYKALVNQKCAPDVARLLTKLTTADGQLPQGFKTSPKISGLVLRDIDERLTKLLNPFCLVHTFWIDDLTISGDYPIAKLKKIIAKIFNQNGLPLNTDKTSISSRKDRQSCTGLIVNCGVSAKKDFVKKIRREIYLCKKFGVKSYMKENSIILDENNFIWSLRGRVSFLNSINKKYEKYSNELTKIKVN